MRERGKKSGRINLFFCFALVGLILRKCTHDLWIVQTHTHKKWGLLNVGYANSTSNSSNVFRIKGFSHLSPVTTLHLDLLTTIFFKFGVHLLKSRYNYVVLQIKGWANGILGAKISVHHVQKLQYVVRNSNPGDKKRKKEDKLFFFCSDQCGYANF